MINAYNSKKWEYNIRDFAQCQERVRQEDASGKSAAVQDINQKLQGAIGNLSRAQKCAEGEHESCATCEDALKAYIKTNGVTQSWSGGKEIGDGRVINPLNQCQGVSCEDVMRAIDNQPELGWQYKYERINPPLISQCQGYTGCPKNAGGVCTTCKDGLNVAGARIEDVIQCRPIYIDGNQKPYGASPKRGWDTAL